MMSSNVVPVPMVLQTSTSGATVQLAQSNELQADNQLEQQGTLLVGFQSSAAFVCFSYSIYLHLIIVCALTH